jgi:hypothetical protein
MKTTDNTLSNDKNACNKHMPVCAVRMEGIDLSAHDVTSDSALIWHPHAHRTGHGHSNVFLLQHVTLLSTRTPRASRLVYCSSSLREQLRMVAPAVPFRIGGNRCRYCSHNPGSIILCLHCALSSGRADIKG